MLAVGHDLAHGLADEAILLGGADGDAVGLEVAADDDAVVQQAVGKPLHVHTGIEVDCSDSGSFLLPALIFRARWKP